MPGGVPCVGESVSLPPTPPRLFDKSNSLMESDELKRRAGEKKEKDTIQTRSQIAISWDSFFLLSGAPAATGWTGKGNGLDFVR